MNWGRRTVVAFPEQFPRARGYDLIPWLPVMTGRVRQPGRVRAVPLGPAPRHL